MRPVVPVTLGDWSSDYVGVVDSGSPMSVADARLFDLLGIDLDRREPLYEIPLRLGPTFGNVPVFQVDLWLRAPSNEASSPFQWRLHLGARATWTLPFSVLFGIKGWFEHFPTTIDGTGTTVHIPDGDS